MGARGWAGKDLLRRDCQGFPGPGGAEEAGLSPAPPSRLPSPVLGEEQRKDFLCPFKRQVQQKLIQRPGDNPCPAYGRASRRWGRHIWEAEVAIIWKNLRE